MKKTQKGSLKTDAIPGKSLDLSWFFVLLGGTLVARARQRSIIPKSTREENLPIFPSLKMQQ